VSELTRKDNKNFGMPVKWELKDKLFFIKFRDEKLCIAVKARMSKYIRGINKRINDLALLYGIDNCIEIQEGDIVFDVGSNIGEISIFCCRLGASVYAFEPDKTPYMALQNNLKNHDAKLFNYALSDSDGMANLYLSPKNADTSIIETETIDQVITIKTERLSTFVEKNDIKSIKLIKCDAEGAEPEVIKGAIGACLRVTNYISIDCGYERRGASTKEECVGLLVENGFEIIKINKSGKRRIVIAKNTTII